MTMILLDSIELHHLEEENSPSQKEDPVYIIHETGKGFRPAREDEYYLFEDEKPRSNILMTPLPHDFQSPFGDIIKSLENRKSFSRASEGSEWTLDSLIDECQKLPLDELKILKNRIEAIIKSEKS